MNIRSKRRKEAETGVMLSPLIDCVFLLLIFFLVTGMIKRFERQIPVSLPDDTSALSKEPNDESLPVGINSIGQIFQPVGLNQYGLENFELVEEPDSWMMSLFQTNGPDIPVTVVVERGTPFQRVIDAQDKLELIGFSNIRFRLRDFPFNEKGNASRH